MEPKTNAQVALEAASRIYAEKGNNAYASSVTSMASDFLSWLDRVS